MNLTKPQKSICNMELYSGGAIAVICTSFFVDGKKENDELQSAVNELFRINDALRIRIVRTGSERTQHITEFNEQVFDVLHFAHHL